MRCLKFFLLIMVLIITASSCINSPTEEHKLINFESFSKPYFGQELPRTEPQIFMYGLISTTLEREYCISFLDQGKVCVFGRDDTGVMYTYLKNGHWTKPESLNLNIEAGEWKHNSGPDDKTLYFMSPRLVDTEDTLDDVDIYKVIWTGSGFSEQELLQFPPNSREYHQIYPSIAFNGNAYFHGGEFWNADNINDDIFHSKIENEIYTKQKRLNEPINTEYDEFDAFIAPEEGFLLFHSNRPGSLGSFDMYSCFKNESGNWTHPVNLGSNINSPDWESCVNVTPDGKALFFVSSRENELFDQEELEKNKRSYATGFYWISTSFMNSLRELMLNTKCAAEVIKMNYQRNGLPSALATLSDLHSNHKDAYHFLPYELLDICKFMIEEGKVEDSRVFSEALANVLPEATRINRGYARVCVLHGLTESGLALLKEAFSIDPENLKWEINKSGRDLLRKSMNIKAVKVFQFNTEEFPDWGHGWHQLAIAYEQLGDLENAINSVQKALELSPESSASRELLDRLNHEKTQ